MKEINGKTFFILFFIVLPMVFIPSFLVIDFYHSENDTQAKNLIKKLDQEILPLLFLGDSVVTSYGACDSGKERIDELIHNLLGKEMISISYAGYNMEVYESYVNLVNGRRNPPEVVVIGINLRTFSYDGAIKPASRWVTKRLYLATLDQGFQYLVSHIATYIKYRFLKAAKKLESDFLELPFISEGKNYGSVKDIYKKIEIPDTLECTKNENKYPAQLALSFRYNYMFDMDSQHPFFKNLNNLNTTLKKAGSKLVVYLTPLNFEDGDKYVGESFTLKVEKNLNVIREFLKVQNITYLDLSHISNKDQFIDKKHACEHLNFEARQNVSLAIVQYLDSLGPKSAPSSREIRSMQSADKKQ